MELAFLRKFEGKRVRLGLKNNFIYSSVVFKITSEGLVEFKDRRGDTISLEPEFIAMISQINNSNSDEG